jgi:hypothetical protein
MTKLTLTAPHKDALKIASCFPRGTKVSPMHFKKRATRLIGISGWSKPLFQVESMVNPIEEITIDLDKNQPCIYACMREGLKVEIERDDGLVFKGSICSISKKVRPKTGIIEECISLDDVDCAGTWVNRIKSIRILGLEDMEGVEVCK